MYYSAKVQDKHRLLPRFRLNKLIKEILEDSKFVENCAWKFRYFKMNEVILKEGDTNKKLFVIETGKLRVSIHVALEGNKSIHTGIFDITNGDVFGENSLFQAQSCNCLVTAVSDGKLIEIDGERLSIYLDDNPIMGYLFFKKLFEMTTQRLSNANSRVENLLAWGIKAHNIEKHL